MAAGRKALLVATYDYSDSGLSRLTAPAHDAESLAEVLRDPTVAGFDVTVLINEPSHVVGEAIADFYGDCRRDDLTLLYFSGHGLKDDNGRLYLAMANTRRDALLFTGLSAAQINEAMETCASRRKVLVLDCCYSGAFPAGVRAKADETVNSLERFQGKGRAVLTASDATQYSFEGDSLQGAGSQSVFTRCLVEAIRTGEADLDADGDIALDELYSYVHEKVVAERPQQRPKKQEDVDGRILIARNVHWTLPTHLRYAIDSPISAQRLSAVEGLAHLHRVGNDLVRAVVAEQVRVLANDDSRSVSTAASALLGQLDAPAPVEPPPPAVPVEPVGAPAGPTAAVRQPEKAPPAAPNRTAPDDRRRPVPTSTPAASAAPVPASAPILASAPVPASGPMPAPAARSTAGGQEPAHRRPKHLGSVLGALVGAAVLLTVSRLLVFDSVNGYRAVDLGWSTATWTLQVTLPLVVAAGLLLARGDRAPVAALVPGLLAGAALGLIGELVGWRAFFTDVGYSAGPAWWTLLAGTVLLVAAVVVGCSAPALRSAARLRRDAVAALAALLVLAALGIWVFAVGSSGLPPGQWLFYKGAGVLFTIACAPAAVLRLAAAQRVFALSGLTTAAAAQVAGGVEILVHSTSGFDMGAVLRAILAVLVALAACYVGQLGRRPASALVG